MSVASTDAPTAADDLHLGSFSDDPPWSLASRPPGWRRPVDILRRHQAEQLPWLTRPPRIPPIRRALTVVRVLGLAIAVWYLRSGEGRPATA